MNMIDICIQGSYAFVDFENEGDAEQAKNELINKDLKGLKINIGKFKPAISYLTIF
jgi:hypothetical protein